MSRLSCFAATRLGLSRRILLAAAASLGHEEAAAAVVQSQECYDGRVIDEALRNGLPLYEPLAPNHFN